MEILLPIVIVFFILSLISERLTNFLKLNLPEVNAGDVFWKIIPGGPFRTKTNDSDLEKIRERRVFWLALISGLIVSFASKANLFIMLEEMEQANKSLWWESFDKAKEPWYELITGCVLTAFFISMGSKFWHDLLDMLLHIKNYKRLLADPETYKHDNITSIDKIITRYESDFIKSAFLEAKVKFMAIDNVRSVAVKSDLKGYFFELAVKKLDSLIGDKYVYMADDAISHSVRIKQIVIGNEQTTSQSLNLSSKIFNSVNEINWGTFGCLVKKKDENDSEAVYLLTCCHNFFTSFNELSKPNILKVNAHTENKTYNPIGQVVEAVRDHEIDAALVKIDPSKINQIQNRMPEMGFPNGVRSLFNRDINTTTVCLYGARSKYKEGKVVSVYADHKIEYKSGEFKLINLIVASINGKSISDSGDSGSVVFDTNNRVIGLVVAGNSRETLIIPIETLCIKFNIELI